MIPKALRLLLPLAHRSNIAYAVTPSPTPETILARGSVVCGMQAEASAPRWASIPAGP